MVLNEAYPNENIRNALYSIRRQIIVKLGMDKILLRMVSVND